MPAVRSGGKSAAAFRTISEVADDLEVPQHVLRFWETKFSQVRPLKRGGGRRRLAVHSSLQSPVQKDRFDGFQLLSGR